MILVHVGKVSSGFACFEETFARELVSKKVLSVSKRAMNILSNAYLSKKFYRRNQLKMRKTSFYTVFFVRNPVFTPNIRSMACDNLESGRVR